MIWRRAGAFWVARNTPTTTFGSFTAVKECCDYTGMKSTIDINETNFETEVLRSTEPVLVDFWGPSCGPCKMLEPILDEIAVELAGRVKVAKVNAVENPNLSLRFGVQALPTLLYIVNGEVQSQTRGAASKKAIIANLNNLLAT
jgi:thioredoxin 1